MSRVLVPCLSVRQPWALAITRFWKNVENRHWKHPRKYRGLLLIHAAKGLTKDEYYCGMSAMPMGLDVRAFPRFEEVERGGIVGACELYDIQEPLDHDEGWAQAGARRLMLRRQIVLPFRPLAGALGFFTVELTPLELAAMRAAGLIDA